MQTMFYILATMYIYWWETVEVDVKWRVGWGGITFPFHLHTDVFDFEVFVDMKQTIFCDGHSDSSSMSINTTRFIIRSVRATQKGRKNNSDFRSNLPRCEFEMGRSGN